ncbi:MAG: LLM class flavin-dependent oxidoreductase [Halobacteriales archaeon]
MKFGVFYEHQLPRPWDDGSERRLYDEALEQVVLADRLGVDYVWEVEHHFLEEYSHSSAPEVFLAACAARTEDIRLGHGIKLTPPAYNHPARTAEQVATLDVVSDGRVEFGTGESGSTMELDAFGVAVEDKYEMWQEATREACEMMASEPYPGYEGEFFEMPARNVVPKPVQEPHPPLWMACPSREMIEVAARHGVGALCFAFRSPDEAAGWVERYHEVFREECVPIGRSVNPRVAMTTGFSCHEDGDVAVERGKEGFDFFRWALAYYYVFGSHQPGFDSLWEEYEDGPDELPSLAETAIGTPRELRETFERYAEAGVDQMILVGQGGKTSHEHICDGLRLFADEVMPEFHEGEEERVRAKREELEPAVQRAFERKDERPPASREDVEAVKPYDRDYSNYL